MQRTLRMCIYNSHENQAVQYATMEGGGTATAPRWTLRIEGRLLPEPGMPVDAEATTKFSHFIKHVSVELDQELYKNDWFVEWDSRRHVGVTDGFELTREGDCETTVKILVEVGYPIQLYSLSAPLAALLKTQVETHDAVLRAIYLHCASHNLIRGNAIECDASLKTIFGEDAETVDFQSLPGRIRPLLTPAPPLELEHRVRVSGTPEENMQCWDVMVQDPPLQLQKGRSEDLQEYEKEVAHLVDQIAAASKRQKAFAAMAKDPAQFVHLLMRSETCDAALLEAHEDSESHRHAEFYMHPYIADAARQYLLRQKTGDRKI